MTIASRVAWTPPLTGNGESLVLLEYAGPVGPDEEIIEKYGQKYVVRKPEAAEFRPPG